MRNITKFNSITVKIIMIFVLGIMILPLNLFADGGGTKPPPPDSSGHNDMVIIDTTSIESDFINPELSILESMAVKLILYIVL